MYKIIVDSWLYLLGLKFSFFRRRYNVRHKSPIKLWYWKHTTDSNIGNFGDEITKDIILKLFGYNSVWVKVDECELIGAGSVIESTIRDAGENRINIWGSGFIGPGENYRLSEIGNLNFRAVRGKISRERLGSSNIPLGDPGLLVNLVYKRSNRNDGKIGVVVHYVDEDLPIVKKIKSDDRFTVINPIDDPQNVAIKITACGLILSSSLHGLVFADSFGIANAHIKLSDNVVGGEYKFKDYYSALNRDYIPADINRIFDAKYLDKLRSTYRPVKNLRKVQRGLIKAFPYR